MNDTPSLWNLNLCFSPTLVYQGFKPNAMASLALAFDPLHEAVIAQRCAGPNIMEVVGLVEGPASQQVGDR